ncbi:MAG: hypothetical protein IBX55_08885 [Methyloprofundus sp.]|nr:hypothetical protein [Methyloprofundus sp.]
MKVSGLDKNKDWTFGRGKATYIQDSAAIAQAVETRIKEFKNDWYADVDAGIDWLTLLSNRNTQKQIENEIRRVILQTRGVIALTALDFSVNSNTRHATITAAYQDIFNKMFTQIIEVG